MAQFRLDPNTLTYIRDLLQGAAIDENWKVALDKLLRATREEFVFDNVAIYLIDQISNTLEITYARAIGREKTAEADATWGEIFANQVLEKKGVLIQEPVKGDDNRLLQAYLLGLPLYGREKIIGVMVLIRFGGPEYKDAQITLATIIGSWVSVLLNRKVHIETDQILSTLQQKVQLQDDFVATISHELRTPLGFIKGYTTTLLRKDTTWDDETKIEFLTIIDEETDRLTQLIDNILESAKLQSSTIELNLLPLRLDSLIRDVVVRVQARNKDLRIEVDLDKVPPIQGDNIRLTQVLDNLFSNSTKYAPGSNVLVRIKKEKKYLLITFSDEGPGIPNAYLPYIFERFYRVPGENNRFGSGLGLYICNQIILAHHGKIWVESEIDRGTTFFIQLPIENTA
ncbi:MAG: HAMP domain-containing sensor histidine kinase [Anaerolineae bacterium]|nr:HAMP domain-containing sensor histidine kinase [Anaerolineae bacterium]